VGGLASNDDSSSMPLTICSAVRRRLGVPCRSAVTSFSTWSRLTMAGYGGSGWSVTHSMIAGPSAASASDSCCAHRLGSSIRTPRAPQASANFTKSNGAMFAANRGYQPLLS
jgi:hypothetical protein